MTFSAEHNNIVFPYPRRIPFMVYGIAFSLIIMMVACSGCIKEKTYRLSGTVTYNGQLVPGGNIMMTPDPASISNGRQVSIGINNGKFDTGSQGPLAGIWKVEIQGVHQFGEGNNGPVGTPLFSSYKETFTMPKQDTIHDFQVTGPQITIQ